MALQPAYGNSVGTTPGSIPASALADGVVPSGVRRAALFDGSPIEASVLWAPTTAAHSIGITVAVGSGGTPLKQLIGRQSLNRANLLISPNGSVTVRNSASNLATTPAGSVAFDGTPHVILATMTSTSVVVSINGVTRASATIAATAWDTTAAVNLIGTNSAGTSTVEATLSDVRFIDPASATNTATFPLDGDFQNTEPGSTVADATVTGDVDFVTVLGESTKPMLAVPYQGVATGVRRGARFENQSGVQGTTSWAPTTQSFSFEFTASIDPRVRTGGIAHRILDSSASGLPNVTIITGASGNLLFRSSVSDILAVSLSSIDQYLGVPSVYRVDVTATTAVLSINGTQVASNTHSVTWGTVAGSLSIGKTVSGGSSMWGTIYDVRLIDPASTANTAYFPLDGLDSSGNFPNEHPGSTVADATVTGLVQFAQVLSSDGGRALPVGRAVYLHSVRRNVSETMDGSVSTSATATFDATDLNETGGMDAVTGTFTAPCAGIAEYSAILSIRSVSEVDTINIKARLSGPTVNLTEHELAIGVEVPSPISGAVAVTAGDTLSIQVINISATNTLSHRYSMFTVRFYPTAP